MNPKISIIIRTKNEEKWIGHCLNMVFKQNYNNIEVIIVDNVSTDNTINIANRYPIHKIISINNFLPGLALNNGIRESKGEYIVCLSAHCIPKESNWLSNFIANFNNNPNIAGVYGRQLPVSFTEDIDKRDLLLVFGEDRRVQIKDCFFHNANSILPRKIWEQFPFNEEVTNIEDRVWGKAVIENKYNIIYDPTSAVYHYHGLHQGNPKKRTKGVVSIIDKVEKDLINELPDSLKPENINIVAIIPILGKILINSEKYKQIIKTILRLQKSKYLKNIYILSEQSDLAERGTIWLDRNNIYNNSDLSIDLLIMNSLELVESNSDFPDSILYINYEYMYMEEGLIDRLISEAQYKGYDSVFPGYIDYGHYWYMNEDGFFKETDSSLKSREYRKPIYKALYGIGCVTSCHNIRKGKLIGNKIGILPISNLIETLRLEEYIRL